MIEFDYSKKDECHDCGVLEGEIHWFGCDMETCPWCGGQLLGCPCVGKQLKLHKDDTDWIHHIMTKFPSRHNSEEWLRFSKIMDDKGRIPYIILPSHCVRCGVAWPDHFKLSDDEWKSYMGDHEQKRIICLDCWRMLKGWVDENRGIDKKSKFRIVEKK